MKIGIDVNNVVRDTLRRIEQIYEKWYIENPYFSDETDDFEYKIISPVTTLDLKSHLAFKNDEHLYEFLYTEHTMEIFGHAGSVEYSTFHDLNDFYLEMRDNHEIILVSDEIGKSKPATLFFISKFGCLVENVSFYSEQTKNLLWDKVDVLLTANPSLISETPQNKKIVKYNTIYNTNSESMYQINKLSELKQVILEMIQKK
jgi:hypothetical protein